MTNTFYNSGTAATAHATARSAPINSEYAAIEAAFDKVQSVFDAALLSAGLIASSTTSLTVGTGTQNLTIDTGKSFVGGMSIKIARDSAPTTYMLGEVTSYNSVTGALVVSVSSVSGSGTETDWNIFTFTQPVSALTRQAQTTGTTLTGAQKGYRIDCTSSTFSIIAA